jgi:predicted TIM-barrel fold metal-dependent hydrolase
MGLDIAGRYRYPPPRTDWLALHAEEIIEPTLPIIDAHHHIWTEAQNPYLLENFAADLATGHNVVASVAVQAHYGYRAEGPEHLRCVGESEKLAAVRSAARSRALDADVGAAFVGFADLMLAERVAPVIEAHIEAAPASFRGIRHSVSRDPHFPDGIVLRAAPQGLLADKRYRAGLAKVAQFGLTYDAMLYHRQIPELAAAAKAVPHLQMVLDHIGCIIGVGPYEGKEDESFRHWHDAMTELAHCPNVNVKIGGFGMIICGAKWHERRRPPDSEELARAWRPYIESCIELFGAERCMFESNFPVDKAMYSYAVLWNAFKRVMVGAPESDKDMLFRGTAARVYRISKSVECTI